MAKDKTTEVSRIILKVGGKEISLTPEEVKDLKEALDRMYPNAPNVIREYYPQYVPMPSFPRPWYYSPYIYATTGSNNLATLTCQSATGKLIDQPASIKTGYVG